MSFLITVPDDILQYRPMFVRGSTTTPAPRNVYSPMLDSPLTSTCGEITAPEPIETSWPIVECTFIIALSPIFEKGPMKTNGATITPCPIFASDETTALGCIIVMNFPLRPLSQIFLLDC